MTLIVKFFYIVFVINYMIKYNFILELINYLNANEIL